MIDNYFDNVSNNEKKDFACEIILELGDDDLELLVPNFKVARCDY